MIWWIRNSPWSWRITAIAELLMLAYVALQIWSLVFLSDFAT